MRGTRHRGRMGSSRGTTLLTPPPLAGPAGPRWTSANSSGRTSSDRPHQIPDADQVVHRGGEGEHPPGEGDVGAETTCDAHCRDLMSRS
jgi:hypothetical protein